MGLIGGSLAKAYSGEGHTVYAFDKDDAILGFAQLSDVVYGVLDENALGLCDVIFLAINPEDAVAYLEGAAPNIAKNAIVIDCCGVKRFVCEKCFPLAEKHGFVFVGGHPMAGSHKAGFKNSSANLFYGAAMVLVPPIYDDAALFGRIEDVLAPVGFGHLTISTAEEHDRLIAFSSQMAHLVSNAYIKSPSATDHKGFSAGSYRDLTRVARLDAAMWSELFSHNSDCLINELDTLIDSLASYKNALAVGDRVLLKELLEEGSRLKKELDHS